MNQEDNGALLTQLFNAVCSGDFTYRLPAEHPYADAANRMMQHLDQQMLSELNSKVKITMASFENTIAMGKLGQVATSLHERTTSMAAATEEMSATVQTMAGQAHEVGELSNHAKSSVMHGMRTIDDATQTMASTVEQMEQTVRQIDQLKTTSKEIESLLAVIRKISDQTNLLALNATIEAARAGEAGKGFAVVAGEVKELSRQTAKATESIGEKSGAIQQAVTGVVESIGNISDILKQSADSLATSQQSMQTIESNMLNVDQRVNDIRYASQDQSTASAEIAEGLATISDTSEELDQMAKHALDSTDGLEEMLKGDLKRMESFKVNGAVIQLAKTDHMLWKKRLVDMLIGRGQINSGEVTDHHQCRLGKWYDNSGKREYGHDRAFRELESPHAKVHELAQQAVEKFNHGDHAGAISAVETIAPMSDEVIRLLSELERSS